GGRVDDTSAADLFFERAESLGLAPSPLDLDQSCQPLHIGTRQIDGAAFAHNSVLRSSYNSTRQRGRFPGGGPRGSAAEFASEVRPATPQHDGEPVASTSEIASVVVEGG